MSKKDQNEVFISLRKQGFGTEYNGGHMKITCKEGCDQEHAPGLMITNASTTPSDIRGTERLKIDLRRHGWLPPGEYKEKQRQDRAAAKEARRAERLAAASKTPPQEQETTRAGEDQVPQIGDVARVTKKGGKPVDAEDLMPANNIVGNIEMAAELLWEQVIQHIKEDGADPLVYGTVRGYRWEGSRDGAIRELWPTIPRGVPGDKPDPRRIALSRYLSATANMVCLDPGNRYKKSVWWVRAEFSRVKIEKRDTLTERRLTAHEAGEDRDPQPVTVSHKNTDDVTVCPECDEFFVSDELNEHRLREHAICPECGKKGHDYRTTQIHRSTVHKVRSDDYERNRAIRDINAGLTPVRPDKKGFLHCPDCSFVTTSRKMFSGHRRNYLDQPHPEPIFNCRLCPERVETPQQIQVHYQDAHGTPVAVCRRCGEAYGERKDLYRHKREAHQMRRTRDLGELYPGDPGYDDAVHVHVAESEEDPAPEPEEEEPSRLVETPQGTEVLEGDDPDEAAIAYFASLVKYQTEQRERVKALEDQVAELQTENDRLHDLVVGADAGKVTELEKALTMVTNERDQLRTKLDVFQAAFKGLAE